MIRLVDVAVIGGGPAGMAAACSAKRTGAQKVVIIEREPQLGGILEQCVHNGFGLHMFKEELTGPEYGERYKNMVDELDIEYMLDTMVTDISSGRVITAVNKTDGYFQVKAKAIVLAMGCRERPRGSLMTPGTRPSGVITAGTAQKLVNIKGYMPGKKIVILGSGDIGLIMARRMTLEGGEVKAVCEIMEDSGGLTRNIVQCLQDFNIPLKLHTTVVKIHGKNRVEGVTIARVDDNLKPVPGTEEYIECDTLMLSVGLIPENELSKKAGVKLNQRTKGPEIAPDKGTSVPGIYACGNVVKVHELVDYVSEEGEMAGKQAARFAISEMNMTESDKINSESHNGHFVHREQKKGVKNLSDNGEKKVICTICPMGCEVHVSGDEKNGFETKGNTCGRGKNYAIQEVTAPKRTLTSTMAAYGGVFVPVKTDGPIPKEKMKEAMNEINNKTLLLPISCGTIIIENIVGTGTNLIATRTFD